MLGGIEAGGTKFVCVVGSGPDGVVAEDRFPTGEPAADDRPRDRVLRGVPRLRRPARGGRHRRVRPGRAAPLQPCVRDDHDDAEARLVGDRSRRPGALGARGAGRVRHRRQRGRPRRGPLGRGARARELRVPDDRDGHRRRRGRRGAARPRPRAPRDGSRRGSAAAGRRLRRLLPVPRRLPRGDGERLRDRRPLGPARGGAAPGRAAPGGRARRRLPRGGAAQLRLHARARADRDRRRRQSPARVSSRFCARS